MASTGRELLKDHYEDEHLSFEEIEALGLKVVTENGETLDSEQLQGKVFRIVDRDEPSGYVVRSMETTGQSTVLCYLQAAS
jgi:hypothetical protein